MVARPADGEGVARIDQPATLRAPSIDVARGHAGVARVPPTLVDPASTALPRLIVARASAGPLLASARHWRIACGGDLLSGLLFRTIAVANVAHALGMGGQVDREQHWRRRRPVSTLSIAQSLNIPYETVRGHVTRLKALGLCQSVAGGVIVPEDVASRPEIVTALDATIADFRTMIARLTIIGARFAPEVLAALDPAHRHERLGLEIVAYGIGVVDRVYPRFGDFTRGILFYAIVECNVRHLTVDPVLAWRYGDVDTLPPDAERRPVSVRMIAREMALPYETVRRHAAALILDGRVICDATGGLVAPHRVIGLPGELAHLTDTNIRFVRALGAIAQLAPSEVAMSDTVGLG